MVAYSIITPTFNRRGVIVRSLESSLAFVRAVRNAELVVIDDASRDGTVELLCGRYADEIARGVMTLRVRSTNGGVTAVRNDGIIAARAAWLIFIDSDDQLLWQLWSSHHSRNSTRMDQCCFSAARISRAG